MPTPATLVLAAYKAPGAGCHKSAAKLRLKTIVFTLRFHFACKHAVM